MGKLDDFGEFSFQDRIYVGSLVALATVIFVRVREFRLFFLGLLLSLGHVSGEPIVSGMDLSAHGGHVLIGELSCVSCHQGDFESKGGPVLDKVGERVRHDYLVRFLAKPHSVKPGTTMPDVFHGLSEKERKEKALALTEYLVSLGTGHVEGGEIQLEAVERGKVLYESVGCAACHDPEGKEIAGSVPLLGLEKKYGLGSLREFLKDPLKVRPSGRMPDMKLTHEEAEDLAAYLLRGQKAKKIEPMKAMGLLEKGREIYQEVGCAQCHGGEGEKKVMGPDLKSLVLKDDCGGVRYGLSDKQVGLLKEVVGVEPVQLKLEEKVGVHLAQMNCVACHERGGFGGVMPARDEYFKTTNLNLGEQARIPPKLDLVGAKLKSGWMRKVLVGGEEVRPYMTTRMPRHGVDNVEKLLEWLPKVDRLEEVKIDKIAKLRDAHDAGYQLLGSKGLSCISCHTYLGESGTTLAGLEMTSMASRLQENWFHQFMRDPSKFQQGTIMPSFWPGGKAVRKDVLEGNSSRQIDAIWQYLERGREGRTPQGVKREPIYFGPTGEDPVVFRRQYHGIGKRGIGVGYPGGMNLSFCAQQLRVGTIWKGKFGEMSGVWRGQGSGNVNEQSRQKVRFPEGPAFVRLEDGLKTAWPILEKGKRVEGFRFLGYDLDQKRRPVFRYVIGEVTVEDSFVDEVGHLTRALKFDGETKGWFFRIAADQKLEKIEGGVRLPGGLEVLAVGIVVRDRGGVREGVIDLVGQKSVKVIYKF